MLVNTQPAKPVASKQRPAENFPSWILNILHKQQNIQTPRCRVNFETASLITALNVKVIVICQIHNNNTEYHRTVKDYCLLRSKVFVYELEVD